MNTPIIGFKTFKKSSPCPCGSNKSYNLCCGPLIEGVKPAATAKALMKSRYTAYVLKDENYLAKTWHPSTRPAKLELSADQTEWQQLKVMNSKRGKLTDKKGWVAFAAFYQDEKGNSGVLKEESMFVREAGRWYYHSGLMID
jgi:SEC-C motif-containing protein